MCIFIEPNEHPSDIGWDNFDKQWYAPKMQNMHKHYCRTLSKLLEIKL